MLRARKLGVPTPALYLVDLAAACIYMEKVVGHSLKTTLKEGTYGQQAVMALMRSLGVLVAKLHDGGVVHGDLTTSNVMVVAGAKASDGPSLVIIDFGLSYFSSVSEDRAVDLYVLERAFTSAHAAQGEELFAEFLESYRKSSRNWCSTLNRFAEGESGRGARGLVPCWTMHGLVTPLDH